MDVKILFSWIAFCSLVGVNATQRIHRTCDRCMRSPSTCRRISGLYTVSAHADGAYNPVVEIPASACSINITEQGSSRNYIGVKTSTNKAILNSHWSLGQPGQYYGAGTRFAYDRASGNCQGSCVYAEGPTTEAAIVELLYYGKNPGIAYEFILPNSVPFRPFDEEILSRGSSSAVASSSKSSTSSSSLSPLPASSSSSLSSSSSSSSSSSLRVPRIQSAPASSLHQSHRRYRQHQRRRGVYPSTARLIRRTNVGSSESEFYNGFVSSRDEGRPDETLAAEGGEPLSLRRVVVNERKPYRHNYTSNGYGSHTLGGRGLSYTAAGNPTRSRNDQRRQRSQKFERYISGPSSRVRKISAPQYRSSTSTNRLTYPRQQSRYQSLTAKASYLNEVSQPVQRRYLKNDRSSSRGHDRVRFRWKISGLTKCSRTCGGGVQKTNIVCVSLSARKVVVTSDNCAGSSKPRVQTVECNTSPCKPRWEAKEWSECSVTCGSGTQTRQIECRQRFSTSLTLRVSADQCGLESKPAVAQQCEKDLCSTWSVGEWGQCTKECGGGEKRRRVLCVDGLNSPIPGNYCTETRPKDREGCNSQQCNARWWTSHWSSLCSESCGQGYQVRSALCMTGDGSMTSESRCRKEDFPELTKNCYGDSGCLGTWFVGSWGRCSAKCGKGTKRRAVICLQPKPGGNVVVAAGQCNPNLKPLGEESCVNTDCTAIWFTSPWSKCSVMCGDGVKSRDVKCIDRSGSPSEECETSIRPESQETCSLESCNLYQRTDGRLVKTDGEISGSNSIGQVESSRREESQGDKSEVEEIDKGRTNDRREEKGDDDFEVDSYAGSEYEEEPDPPVESIEEYEDDSEELNETEYYDNRGKKCEDSYWNCQLVVQSRLCLYDYYKNLCCVSCRGVK